MPETNTATLTEESAPYCYAMPIGGGWSIICPDCREEMASDPSSEAQEAVADMEPVYVTDALPHEDYCAVCERQRCGLAFEDAQ